MLEPSDLTLLKDYSIAHRPDGNGVSSLRGTVRSSVLFIERYYDILKLWWFFNNRARRWNTWR